MEIKAKGKKGGEKEREEQAQKQSTDCANRWKHYRRSLPLRATMFLTDNNTHFASNLPDSADVVKDAVT